MGDLKTTSRDLKTTYMKTSLESLVAKMKNHESEI